MASMSALEPGDEGRLREALATARGWELWSLRADVATVMCWFDQEHTLGEAVHDAVHEATERAACALLVRDRLDAACVRRLLGGFWRVLGPTTTRALRRARPR